MYKLLIRPILFKIYPETVHHLTVGLIKALFSLPFIRWIVNSSFKVSNQKIQTSVAGLKFKNPVGLAAGFDKNASFYDQFASFGFSHIEIGTVTPKGQPGNPKPRSFRLVKDKALINRMGFNNAGLEAAVKNLKKRKTDIIIGGNIGKNTATPNELAVDDYLKCFIGLYDWVDYFVVNVSCPNVSNLAKLQDQDSLDRILKALVDKRKQMENPKPIFLKISPDLNSKQVDETIEISEVRGLDGLVVANTTVTRDNLKTSKNEIDKIGNGGMSGLPIRDKSTELIRYVSKKTKLPIIGVGGIMTAQDALDKLDAGASLIQVYTGFIYEGPKLVKKINKALVKRTKA